MLVLEEPENSFQLIEFFLVSNKGLDWCKRRHVQAKETGQKDSTPQDSAGQPNLMPNITKRSSKLIWLRKQKNKLGFHCYSNYNNWFEYTVKIKFKTNVDSCLDVHRNVFSSDIRPKCPMIRNNWSQPYVISRDSSGSIWKQQIRKLWEKQRVHCYICTDNEMLVWRLLDIGQMIKATTIVAPLQGNEAT